MVFKTVDTRLGKIALYEKKVPYTLPLIFLHGVYFDHRLWNYQASQIDDRTIITIDMPLHGKSKEQVPSQWNLEDCGHMLIDLLEALRIDSAIAVGHSWGSMTLLRAAHQYPEKFQAVGFCNMPFKATTSQTKLQFKLQHLLLPFRKFYVQQVAKAMFSKQTIQTKPAAITYLQESMGLLSNQAIRQTDHYVIVQAEDTSEKIPVLKMPALALKGKEDYVPAPETLKTTLVEGGHVSPLEAPEATLAFIYEVIALVK